MYSFRKRQVSPTTDPLQECLTVYNWKRKIDTFKSSTMLTFLTRDLSVTVLMMVFSMWMNTSTRVLRLSNS